MRRAVVILALVTALGAYVILTSGLGGEQKDSYWAMIFPNFDCANAGGDRLTAQPDSSDAPSCFTQDPPAWPPGNKSRYPHVDAANHSK